MELHKSNSPVTIVGGAQTSSFSIAMNSKAFRVLTDNLYQDKIGSIVREISCNAYDGHCMAGTPERPFRIHLPDAFEPWFTVKDFGVGLSPNAIKDVFCIFFESTKDQSNDAVGAFGLGAKTPFSYTDQFNVTSIYNGRKYIYNMFINSSGIPESTLMMESDTKEENGVEIKMGVKPEDFINFRTAVQEQLRFFKVPPIVENGPEGFTIANSLDGTPMYESENITLLGGGRRVYDANINIVQGPVGYALQYAMLSKFLDVNQRSFLDILRNVGANLYFKIGEIGVTASREGVEYNEFTVNNIKNKLDIVQAEIVQWINDQLKTIPLLVDKVRFYNSQETFRTLISGITMDFGNAKRDTNGTYYFNLNTLPSFLEEGEYAYVDATGATVSKKRKYLAVAFTEYYMVNGNRFTAARTDSSDARFVPHADNAITIIIRDGNCGRAPVSRMRHYFLDTPNCKRIIAITPTSEGFSITDDMIKELSEHLGGYSNIVRLSELPDPPRVSSPSQARSDYSRPTAYAYEHNSGHDMSTVASWSRIYDKFTEDFVKSSNGVEFEKAAYVIVERQRVTSYYNSAVDNAYKRLRQAKMDVLPVFAIRANDEEKLKDSPTEWVQFDTYVNEVVAEISANPAIKRFVLLKSISEIMHRNLNENIEPIALAASPKSRIARIFNLQKKIDERLEKAEKFPSAIINIAGVNSHRSNVANVFSTIIDNMFKKTPLLDTFFRYRYGGLSEDEINHLVAYVDRFDAVDTP